MDYTKLLSSKACGIQPSGIRKFFDLLDGRKDVVALTVGQPDFKTPWHIREAGIDSLTKGKTYYTANSGMMSLRNEISEYLNRRFSLSYNAEKEIIVTVGGSEAIDIAVRAMVDVGDEVIIPTPSFVCYEPIVSLAGGVPVIMETKREDDFKINAETLKSLITNKTKLLILPFPNNPTGAVLDRENLEEIASVLRDTNIAVLSDEIYAELTYDHVHESIASIEGMRERTVIASGFSKAYAMTGWRMGYCVAPAPITEQMYKIHQYAIMCAPTVSQYASVEALKNGDADIEMMKREYNRRRKYIISGLRNIGIDCFEAKGAFYVFPKIGDFGMSSDEFCERLLNENGVAIVPGTAFGKGGEGFARISYAYSVNHIAEALERIEEFIKDKR
ncbi:MAG: aminotransferase class I/II-fold pyridoxal phosphate-dependent enzyme [Ruminococcaceae bacterium]|nr:aminotransferase class I/II-fold pyridoxal phosphate-dependent enzyme [Oscillospiraceae bacterium]